MIPLHAHVYGSFPKSWEVCNAVTAAILETGGKAIFLRTDVRKAAECQRAVDETVKSYGRLDILFNNAGVFYPHDTLACSEQEWDEQIDINLKGCFLMSKAALPPWSCFVLAKGGTIS